MSSSAKDLGTENVRWTYQGLYRSIDDPQLEADVKAIERKAADFKTSYDGQLGEKLSDAIKDITIIEQLAQRVFMYLLMRGRIDVNDTAIQAKDADIRRRLMPAFAEGLTFFSLQLAALPQTAIDAQSSDAMVSRHLPYINDVRKFRPHQLSREVEEALSKRTQFGPASWSDFYTEFEASLRFEVDGRRLTLTEATHLLSESKDADLRARANKALNDGLGGIFGKFSARTLYEIAGEKRVEDRERNYPSPMSAVNLTNKVDEKTVEALHTAVRDVAGPIVREWYALKREILGIETMRWSDRNAPLPFESDARIPYEDAMNTVMTAYREFSPTLADLVEGISASGGIDAPLVDGKDSGAFNISGVLPDGKARTYVFTNYLGSPRDVLTLAHELGHACHGLLAGEAQGALMCDAPLNYAETASIFGEMLAFDSLMRKMKARGDAMGELALVAGKLDDMMNSAVRQISFSNFERRVHGTEAKLSDTELNMIWKDVTEELYGKEGEVFRYEDMEKLWAYIPHFHRPFYVYAYAFGELLTQSLFAKKNAFGDAFEPMYLDLLRAGNTKNAVELLAPFDLDPTDPDFWAAGIRNSMGRMLEEAKRLWKHSKTV